MKRRLEKKHLRKAGMTLFGVEVSHYCVVTAIRDQQQ